MKTAIVFSDMQCPFQDKRSVAAVEQYMSEHKWDIYINIGDFLDYFTIARFNEGKPGLIDGMTILEECAEGERVLQRHVDIVRKNNPKAQMYLLEGNHEYRATAYTHKYPQLKGIIEPEVVLKLKEKRVTYVKSHSEGEVLSIGKANFIHGNYTNSNHAKKHVEAYEDNIFYGHTHTCDSFNKTSMGTGKTKVGQSIGCLCAYPKNVDYTMGGPNKWQQAFVIFYFRDDGHFNYNLVRIFDHTFTVDGKTYKG